MNGDEHDAEHDNPGDYAFPLQEPHGQRGKKKGPKADDKSKKPNWKRRAHRTNVVIAFFACATAVVGALQWNSMDRQLNAMREANKLAREDLALANRPWLVVQNITIENKVIDAAVPIKTKLTLHNAGNSPATGYVRTTVFVAAANLGKAPEIPWGGTVTSQVTVGPGLPAVAVGDNPIGGNLGLAGIGTGEMSLYIFGVIRYRGPLVENGETRFCYRTVPDPSDPEKIVLTACPFHGEFE